MRQSQQVLVLLHGYVAGMKQYLSVKIASVRGYNEYCTSFKTMLLLFLNDTRKIFKGGL